MSQKLLYLMGPDAQLAKLTTDLSAKGFEVTPSRRATGGVHVRIREGTDDETVVQAAVDAVAPNAKLGPSASPTHDIAGYRAAR